MLPAPFLPPPKPLELVLHPRSESLLPLYSCFHHAASLEVIGMQKYLLFWGGLVSQTSSKSCPLISVAPPALHSLGLDILKSSLTLPCNLPSTPAPSKWFSVSLDPCILTLCTEATCQIWPTIRDCKRWSHILCFPSATLFGSTLPHGPWVWPFGLLQTLWQ